MPFVAPILIAVGSAIAGLGAIGTAILSTVISIGLGFVAKALAPKPKTPEFQPFSPVVSDRTQMVRQPITSRRYPFGEVKTGGILTHVESASDNKTHRMIVTLCDGPIDGIPVVWFNDQPIWADQIDANGEILTGPFKGKATITKYLGATDQAANPNVDIGSFRGRGIAYLDCLIRWNADTYPTGLPDISAEVRGLKFTDQRDTASPPAGPIFTLNNAVIARGLILDTDWGMGYEDDTVPDTWFNAAANICDEFVTSLGVSHRVASVSASTNVFKLYGGKLRFQTGDRVEVTSDESPGVPAGTPSPAYVIVVRSRNRGPSPKWEVGIDDDTTPEKLEIKLASSYADAVAGTAADIADSGGGTLTITKTGEPRYTINGVHESRTSPIATLDEIVRAMAGRAVYAGGEWRVRAGAYVTPDVNIVARDIIAPVKIQTRVPRRDRFNAIRGAYYSPLNDWQPSDFPHVTDATYEAEDGERIYRDMDLPFTTRSNTAQRLAQIELRRSRGNEISVDLVTTLKGMKLQAGDTCTLTLDDFGFDEKPFEDQTWALTVEEVDGAPMLAVNMTLRETQPSIYSFNPADDETPVEPIARTTLSNPWFVPAPTSLYARTAQRETDQGDIVFTAYLTWAIEEEGTIDERGRFEIQTRRSTGGALFFDGVDDYVSFGAIDLTAEPAPFTIEGWAQWDGTEDSPPADQGIWTNGQVSIYRRASDGLLVADFFSADITLTVESDDALPADEWEHFAVTWDGEALRLYIGAVLNDEDHSGDSATRVTLAGDTRATLAGDTRITADIDTAPGTAIAPQMGRGKGSTANTAYWPGGIDEFRVWKGVARTQAEIEEFVSLALTGREDGLFGYWPMDVPIAGQLIDGTINGNTGTITGATYGEGALGAQWEPSWFVDGEERATILPMMDAAQMYDIRIRSVNAVGVRSAWSQLTGFVVGSSGGATDQEDWGLITDAADSPATDWGAITDAATETEDYGALI